MASSTSSTCVWDLDASGEFLFLEREGKKLMSNLNKNGYVCL